MRLAANETTLRLSGETKVTLRPSLRAAYRLLAGDDAILALLNGISDFDTAIISRIIRESATDEDEADQFIAALLYSPTGIASKATIISSSLVAHVTALLGVNLSDDKPANESKASRLSFTEYFEQLFSIATGWLHWTPETTWKATPAEILAAHAGHMEMLRLLYGSPDAGPNDPSFERDENGFAELKALAHRLGGAVR